ncbi:MAG TPA: glycine/betaine ABC transporter substrate-binding protein, partial [Firmicutes bacterium]|nr:glycine/betaine ABC transporter substrate-binding protein [Bacillota bacterium]
MKRILTLAIAAILVVAFAIPALAAPKVEIVGG